eukprot:3850837-Pyramimonas_sp.AAC.2
MKRPRVSPVPSSSKAARREMQSSTESVSPRRECPRGSTDTAFQRAEVISVSSDTIPPSPSLFVNMNPVCERDGFWIRLYHWELRTWPWKELLPHLLEEYLENLSHSEDLPFSE